MRFAEAEGLDALGLSETWLAGHEVRAGPTYQFIRGHESHARAGGRHGGRLTRGQGMLVRVDSAGPWVWRDLPGLQTAYTQWVCGATVTDPNTPQVMVGSFYIPGRGRSHQRAERGVALAEVHRTTREARALAAQAGRRCYVLCGGDVNGRLAVHADTTTNVEGKQIQRFAENHDLTVASAMPHATGGPTFNGRRNPARSPARATPASSPDMALVSNDLAPAVTAVTAHADAGVGSDHSPVTLTAEVPNAGPTRDTAQRPTSLTSHKPLRIPRNTTAVTAAIENQCADWLKAGHTEPERMATALAAAIERAIREATNNHSLARPRPARPNQRRTTDDTERVAQYLNDGYERGDATGLWQWLRKNAPLGRKTAERGRIGAIRTAEGMAVTDQAIASAIAAHLKATDASLQAPKTAPPHPAICRRQPTPMDLTADDVTAAIQRQESRRAAGPDGIPPAALKLQSPALREALLTTFNAVLRSGTWPAAWSEGTIIPLPKPGSDLLEAGNYRPITLLSAIGKLFEGTVNARLTALWEDTDALSDSQYGFRPNRSTLAANFVLHETAGAVMEADTESKGQGGRRRTPPLHAPTSLHVAFLDVKRAYDGAWRAGIIEAVRARGVDDRTAALLADMLRPGHVRRTVIANGARSEPFTADAGVPQGAVLSPALYSAFIDDLLRRLDAAPTGGVHVHGIRICAIAFADDVAVLADSREALQAMLETCTAFALERYFRFNAAKSRAMVLGADADDHTPAHATLLEPDGTRSPIPEVRTFKHLGLEADLSQRAGRTARWEGTIKEHCRAARLTTHQLWTLHRRLPGLAPGLLAGVWCTVARARLEFGAQIWAPELTAKQRAAMDAEYAAMASAVMFAPTVGAKGCGAAHAFTLAEIGATPPSFRADGLALRFLWRTHAAPPTTTLRRLADARLAAARQWATNRTGRCKAGSRAWALAMKPVMAKYGVEDVWTGTKAMPTDATEWTSAVNAATRKAWLTEWRAEAATHRSLDNYTGWGLQPRRKPVAHLRLATYNPLGRDLLAKARAGVLLVGSTISRIDNPKDQPNGQLCCPLCGATTDDVTHCLACSDGESTATARLTSDILTAAEAESPQTCAAYCAATAVGLFEKLSTDRRVTALLSGHVTSWASELCKTHRRMAEKALTRTVQNALLTAWRRRCASMGVEPVLAYGLTGRVVLGRPVLANGRPTRDGQLSPVNWQDATRRAAEAAAAKH